MDGGTHIILACATAMELCAVLRGIADAFSLAVPEVGEGLPLPGKRLPTLNVPGFTLSLLVCGVGPVASAYSLGTALASHTEQNIAGVVHMGVCGTYDEQKAPLGGIVLITDETYPEYGLRSAQGTMGPMTFPQAVVDDKSVFTSLALQPEKTLGNLGLNCHSSWARGTGVTVAGVSATPEQAAAIAGQTGGLVESMEGFSLALGCAVAGVDFVELRAVSNRGGLRPPDGWDLPGALQALGKAAAFAFAG